MNFMTFINYVTCKVDTSQKTGHASSAEFSQFVHEYPAHILTYDAETGLSPKIKNPKLPKNEGILGIKRVDRWNPKSMLRSKTPADVGKKTVRLKLD